MVFLSNRKKYKARCRECRLIVGRVEGFLDGVGHRAACQRSQPFALSSQAGQVPQP